jgi:sugar phosphate isomerase/epimerase
MRIGMVTDSLGKLSFEAVLDAAVSLGVECVEFGTGNFSTAPHIDIEALLRSKAARDKFTGAIADRGLSISTLNCNGNSLHPGKSGREHDKVIRKTIELAPQIGVDRIVLMSGLPGGPGDKHPNWITVAWPPETTEILEWQWKEVVIPYWKELVAFARSKGIRHLCLEMHGGQNVYNVATLLRLREACGAAVGANFDPSHLLWMGADPIAAIEALGPAIFHVHAKDTRIDPRNAAVNSRIETLPSERARERSWNYVTLGYGNGDEFWRAFCLALRRVGYDGALSIEHEDMAMSPMEGMRKSVELLKRVAIFEAASYELPKIGSGR